MPGLEVHLVTPEREVWSGEADFVTARGVDGDLGVLPAGGDEVGLAGPHLPFGGDQVDLQAGHG